RAPQRAADRGGRRARGEPPRRGGERSARGDAGDRRLTPAPGGAHDPARAGPVHQQTAVRPQPDRFPGRAGAAPPTSPAPDLDARGRTAHLPRLVARRGPPALAVPTGRKAVRSIRGRRLITPAGARTRRPLAATASRLPPPGNQAGGRLPVASAR